jgi:hypothetical protein
MSDDRGVRVVCTDKGTHPSRELAVLRLREPEEDPQLLAELRKHNTPERAEELYAVEIIDDMLSHERYRRLRRDHGEVPAPGRGAPRAEVREFSKAEDWPSRWRFRCPTCRRDLQLKYFTAARLVDNIRTAYPETRSPSVDISLLPASLG